MLKFLPIKGFSILKQLKNLHLAPQVSHGRFTRSTVATIAG
jgi:hypothetical protein